MLAKLREWDTVQVAHHKHTLCDEARDAVRYDHTTTDAFQSFVCLVHHTCFPAYTLLLKAAVPRIYTL